MQLLSGYRLILCLCLMFGMQGVLAQELGIYEGEVPVASQSETDRVAAFPAALQQVLTKLAAGDAALAAARERNAADLVQQYRYRQEQVKVDGQWQLQPRLIVRFDPAAVQSLLAEKGEETLWSAQRPKPIVWMAIDDGSGARIVSQESAAALASLVQRAMQRGVTMRLPVYDAQDQQVLVARDVFSGHSTAIDQATQRYGGPALVGSMRRGSEGWIAEWQLRDGEMEIGRWLSVDPQASVALAAGADGAVDRLMQRYSQRLSGPAGEYPVAIEGIDDANDYAWVMSFLQRQPIVQKIHADSAQGQILQLRLSLSAGVENLIELLHGSRLESAETGDADRPSRLVLRSR